MISLSLSAVPAPVLRAVRTLQLAGHQAVIVGGAVRDTLLQRPSKDWDVASSASTDVFVQLFPRCHPTGLKHGTVTVVEDDLPIEVTTFRGDGAYTDGRRPDDVRFGVSLEEDLSRRDFTINAMAWDPAQNILHDPFGGAHDLKQRTVRAVGDALTRFREDGLRPMRAIRIATVLGFTVEESTLRAIPDTIDIFRKIALERVRDEFLKTLRAARPSLGLELFRQTRLLAEFLPELSATHGGVTELTDEQNAGASRSGTSLGVSPRSDAHPSKLPARLSPPHRPKNWDALFHSVDATLGDPIWRLASLLRFVAKPPIADEIGRRFKLSSDEITLLSSLLARFDFTFDLSHADSDMRRLLQQLKEPLLPGLLSIRRAVLLAENAPSSQRAELVALASRFERLLGEGVPLSTNGLALNGDDLMSAGVPRGPKVGAVLRYFLERVIDSPTLNQRDVLLSLIPEALTRK